MTYLDKFGRQTLSGRYLSNIVNFTSLVKAHNLYFGYKEHNLLRNKIEPPSTIALGVVETCDWSP